MPDDAGSLTRRELLEAAAALGALAALGPAAAARAEETAMPYDDYARADATALAALVRSKRASPAELLDAAIARTEAVNGALNAVVLRHFERAREAVRKGLPDGPLRGVPFLLKDLNVGLAGTVTTNGSRFFADAVVPRDSILVDRYDAAGLVIFGKTASPEFGATGTTESTLWGETQNPWKKGFSAGGSSGGAAVAVAAGIVPAAHASDGGGSIRIPASHCGLFGVKPSRGRTPLGPHAFDAWCGLSIHHVISRSVRDSALLLDVSQGAVLGDPYVARPRSRPYLDEVGADAGKLRIGLQLASPICPEVHPDCVAAARRAAQLCEAQGHGVEELAPPPVTAAELYGAMTVVMGASLVNRIQAREKELGRAVRQDELEPRNWESYQRALQFTAAQHEAARQDVYELGRRIVAHQHAYDAVITPTVAIPPPRLGVMSLSAPYEGYARAGVATSAFTLQYNFSGQPAMSVPLTWNADGLPIGAMFAAAPGREDLLFRVAAQLEAAAPWAGRRPALGPKGEPAA